MHVLIDIDEPKLITFYKALISELQVKNHLIEITAPNNLKRLLDENNINSHYIGYAFSLFGLFQDKSMILRSANLLNYIDELKTKVDVGISTGSKTILFTCANLNIPLVLILSNYKENIHPLYKAYEKCFFIFPDDAPDQLLLEKGYDIQKTARYKGTINKENKIQDLKSIKEITAKIEYLSKHMPGGLMA
ncbi:MAG: hypothetical protein A3B68_07975 [Candidatus Melainabacteria bacterium RIFCSPHIGHO2_02_FULL_34_12]|nr:MAG: hypothetical protein A3B68_07975 [Candidatus Melainabacteria bacterium RIFCSPHIGHO2_02_FULL_34_12]